MTALEGLDVCVGPVNDLADASLSYSSLSGWEDRERLEDFLASGPFGLDPIRMEDLVTLPGVGRKTANVVLNVAFGQETIAVDTHIFRVGNRTNMAPGLTPFEVELKLNQVVPDKYKLHAHHWLILHGRYTCLARKPGCPQCVIRDLCEYRPKTKDVQSLKR